jgi:hypothetical protein
MERASTTRRIIRRVDDTTKLIVSTVIGTGAATTILTAAANALFTRRLELRKEVLARKKRQHEKRVEIATELFARLRDVEELLIIAVGTLDFTNNVLPSTLSEQYEKARECFRTYFAHNALLLPDPIVQVFSKLEHVFTNLLLGLPLAAKGKMTAMEIRSMTSERLPPLIEEAERQCRLLVEELPK